MRKRLIIFFLSLIVVLSAFLIIPSSVLGGEGEDKGPIWGEMEVVPDSGNALGEIIALSVRVFWDKDQVEFDHQQIPKNINLYPFELRDALHTSKRSGEYTLEVWEFKIQCLVGKPPMEKEISPILLQYQKKEVSYRSYLEVPGVSVRFHVLTSENSLPEPIIKKLPFRPRKNIATLCLFGFSGVFIFAGIGVGAFLLWRNRGKKEQKSPEFRLIDELISRYEHLCQSFDRGEDSRKILHKLYFLLAYFLKEYRGIELPEEEKKVAQRIQFVYKGKKISGAETQKLLEETGNILRGG